MYAAASDWLIVMGILVSGASVVFTIWFVSAMMALVAVAREISGKLDLLLMGAMTANSASPATVKTALPYPPPPLPTRNQPTV